MNNVTQAELDWFAEGELSVEQRTELFHRLDLEPDGWKRCALALLEHRALTNSLDSLREHASVTPDDPGKVALPAGHANSPSQTVWFNRAIAVTLACLLFVSGYWLAGHQQSEGIDQRVAPMAVHPLLQQIANQEKDVMLAVNQAVERVSVHDRELIALVTLERDNDLLLLPVIQSETLNRQLTEFPEPRIPGPLSRQLTQSGFAIQPHRQFLSVHHQDGSSEVLPVNMLDCRYVGKPVF